jgi:VCBS repeat-containing protein
LNASGSVGATVTGIYGSIVIDANGSYTYTVDNNNPAVQSLRISGQVLTETFTYEMTDTGGLNTLGTVTINIQGANDAPIATSDTNTAVTAGGTANGTAGVNPSGNVLSNDTDVDSIANGETQTVIGVVAGAQANATGSVGSSVLGNYGSIAMAADGSYTYTVDNNHSAVKALGTSADTLTDAFTYTMQDTGGLVHTATVTITIQGANDAPVAVDDSYSTAENSSIAMDVRANDYDLDLSDPFTLTSVSLVSGLGHVQIQNGVLVYTPGTNYDYLSVGETALVTISYEIQDTAGSSDTATVSLTVQGVRDALRVVSQDANATEDVPFAFPISVTQVDTNGEQFSGMTLYGLPVGTQVADLSGLARTVDSSQSINLFGMDLGTLTVNLPTNLSGTIPVVLEVQSTLGPSATQYFAHQIAVESVADAPVGSAGNLRGQIGQTIPFNLFSTLTDLDGSERITLGIRGIPLGMRITDGVQSITSFNDSSWFDVTNWRIDQLRLDTSGGVNASYGLMFRIISTEQSNGSAAETDIAFTVTIDQVLPLNMNPIVPSSNATQATETSKSLSQNSDTSPALAIIETTSVQANGENSAVTEYVPFDDMQIASLKNDEFQQSPTTRRLRSYGALSESIAEEIPALGLPTLGHDVIAHLERSSAHQPAVISPQALDKSIDHRSIEQDKIEQALTSQENQTTQQSRFAGGILAFWNMLRSHAAGLLVGNLSNKESDVVEEQRVTPRSGRRDEDEK